MGKKAKIGNHEVVFRKITDNFNNGNYREAAAIFRTTKFPPQEKKKADQLNIAIHFFWALDFFNKKEYTQALSTIRMFVERFKNKINLPLEKADVLVGLSYLHLNNWDRAAEYLYKAKNKVSTQAFYFYYLLALIYQKKYQDIAVLFEEHQVQIDLLAEDRKQYLAIAFALVTQDFDQAKELLNDYQTIDGDHQKNVAALKAIIADVPEGEHEEQLKFIYKLLLQIPLNPEEKAYLATIPQLKESSKKLKYGELRSSLKDTLKKLCEGGEPLTNEEFAACMEIPEAYRPYIVYNQIAALFSEDVEDREQDVITLLKKYEWYFFQIPESVLLFVQIAYWNQNNFTPTFFWHTLEKGLERFGKSFTPLQLNRLGWRIHSCFQYSDFLKKKLFIRRQTKLVTAYPEMLGIKLRQIMDYAMIPDAELPEKALDLFTFPNFQYGKDIASHRLKGELQDTLNFNITVRTDDGLFLGFNALMVEDAIQTMSKGIITKLLSILTKATTEYKVHPKISHHPYGR